MSREKTIYCPICKQKVAKYDGHSAMNVIVNCKKCNMQVVYWVEEQKTKIRPIPPRNTSSGMRFY